MQHPLRVVVDHIRDAHRGYDLQQVRRNALKESPPPLPPHRLDTHVHNPRVRRRMDRRALALQACPQQIDRVDDARAKSAAEGADGRGGEVRGRGEGVRWGAVLEASVAGDERLLAVFEGGEVDGGVGEHASEAHGEAAVEGADAGRAPHFEGGCGDEAVAVEAAFDGLALHAAGGGGRG